MMIMSTKICTFMSVFRTLIKFESQMSKKEMELKFFVCDMVDLIMSIMLDL